MVKVSRTTKRKTLNQLYKGMKECEEKERNSSGEEFGKKERAHYKPCFL